MADVAMPRLSDSMQEGTILRWLKSDGDEVRRGEELVEIETDKANMTYQADAEGVLEIVAGQGATLAVGETIARIGAGAERQAEPAAAEPEPAAEVAGDDGGDGRREEGAPAPAAATEGNREAPAQPASAAATEGNREAPAQPASAAATEGRRAAGAQPPPTPETAGEGNGRVKASPVARRMARERGLELAALRGTGPGGRIVKADVEAAAGAGTPATAGAGVEAAAGAEAPPTAEPRAPVPAHAPDQAAEAAGEAAEAAGEAAPSELPPAVVSGEQGRGETEVREPTRLQRTVARRMAESKATAPDFVLTVEVDMEQAVQLREQLKAAAGDDPAPTLNDFVVKASALALRDVPRANGAYRDGRFELYSRVNVGVAVAGMDALVVPTVFDADRKSLGQVAREARALAERVRAGAITPPELSGGTFTLSNLGMYGIRRFTAVINPPQAAILSVGELAPRPVARDGEVQVRHVMELTLACDHRILYGADAARFLARVREYLEQPLRLAL